MQIAIFSEKVQHLKILSLLISLDHRAGRKINYTLSKTGSWDYSLLYAGIKTNVPILYFVSNYFVISGLEYTSYTGQ